MVLWTIRCIKEVIKLEIEEPSADGKKKNWKAGIK
jgi:hypothetical protein